MMVVVLSVWLFVLCTAGEPQLLPEELAADVPSFSRFAAIIAAPYLLKQTRQINLRQHAPLQTEFT
jgi:hypothetical protein